MALPSTGALTWGMIVTEFNKPVPMELSDLRGVIPSVPKFGPIELSSFYGKSLEFHKFVTVETDRLDIKSLFTNEEWASPNRKVVHIPEGLVVGSSVRTSAALFVNQQQNGTLLIEISGSIQGTGGLPGLNGSNGGDGGNAISIDVEDVIVTLYPKGSISGGAGGGGSGGRGGNGGDGQNTVTAREPNVGYKSDSYFYTNKSQIYSYSPCVIQGSGLFWNNSRVFSSPDAAPSTFVEGEWTYHRGEISLGDPSRCENLQYRVYRTKEISYVVDGGIGGQFNGKSSSGGYGQGYRNSRSKGLVGEAGKVGSLGAGSGGHAGRGGDGGAWARDGLPGEPGYSGGNGTLTSGEAGEFGGLGGKAGRSIVATKPYTLVNMGGVIDGVLPPFWAPDGANLVVDATRSPTWTDGVHAGDFGDFSEFVFTEATSLGGPRSFVLEVDIDTDNVFERNLLTWKEGSYWYRLVVQGAVGRIEALNGSFFVSNPVDLVDGVNTLYGVIGQKLGVGSVDFTDTALVPITGVLPTVDHAIFDDKETAAQTFLKYAEFKISGTYETAFTAAKNVALNWS